MSITSDAKEIEVYNNMLADTDTETVQGGDNFARLINRPNAVKELLAICRKVVIDNFVDKFKDFHLFKYDTLANGSGEYSFRISNKSGPYAILVFVVEDNKNYYVPAKPHALREIYTEDTKEIYSVEVSRCQNAVSYILH